MGNIKAIVVPAEGLSSEDIKIEFEIAALAQKQFDERIQRRKDLF